MVLATNIKQMTCKQGTLRTGLPQLTKSAFLFYLPEILIQTMELDYMPFFGGTMEVVKCFLGLENGSTIHQYLIIILLMFAV